MTKAIDFDKVADIYDYYVNVLFDVPFFLKETEHFDKPILELMCGTGRVSIPLLEAGRKLICVDYSQKMLDKFSEKVNGKNYRLELLNADISDLNLNQIFDIIILPFHSLQEIILKEQQISALKVIRNHLSDKGICICTLQNPKVRLAQADGNLRIMGKFKTSNNQEMIISYSNLYKNELVSGFQFYDIYNQNNKLVEKRFLEINFRPITFDSFLEMIEEVGFQILNIYGDYDYSEFELATSPYMLFRLKKKNK